MPLTKRNTRRRNWSVAVAVALGITFAAVEVHRKGARHTPLDAIQISGALLRQDKHPNEQSPIANAKVFATGGLFDAETQTDSAGYFHLDLRLGFKQQEPITLRFEHSDYKPVELTEPPRDGLYVVRMEPVIPEPPAPGQPANTDKPLLVKDVRVRYTVKLENTFNVGSVAKQFDVVNTANVPCSIGSPCSPDGKWKASIGSLTLDAEHGNHFQNVIVACVAGPCPFTRILVIDPPRPSQIIRVSALDWSDTATFRVEAEIARTAVRDTVRRSYPAIINETMTFALPADAEGPTVEAQLNGEEIAFPLGPSLILSWATCGVDNGSDGNKVYRCELKSGYAFPQ